MNPQQAVEAPRFNSSHIFSSFSPHYNRPLMLAIETRIPSGTLEDLRKRGHKVDPKGEWGIVCFPTVVEYDTQTGLISGGADVRGHRYALGW